MDNPTEGMTSADIYSMGSEALLDMDYFLNDDEFDDGFGDFPNAVQEKEPDSASGSHKNFNHSICKFFITSSSRLPYPSRKIRHEARSGAIISVLS